MEKLTRRNVRYICFRIQNQEKGGVKPPFNEKGIMEHMQEIKDHMEGQEDFGGWAKFAITWDVDEKSYFVIVKRKSSIYSEWNRVVDKEAKDLPVSDKPKQSTKFITEGKDLDDDDPLLEIKTKKKVK